MAFTSDDKGASGKHGPTRGPGTMIGSGIAIGAGLGVAMGLAFGNLALGIAIGAAIGVALGTAMEQNRGRGPGNVYGAGGRALWALVAAGLVFLLGVVLAVLMLLR